MSDNLKYWLIGFLEAEGSFVVSSRGDLYFVITQGYRNLFILYYIRDMLGFGSVIKQSPTVFRYVVQDKEGLLKILNMVNGNLVLYKKRQQLEFFINKYNMKYGCALNYVDKLNIPTLNDAWVSGFADGDGCFSVSYIETKERFYIRFILSQKEDISFLKHVFGTGYNELNSYNQCYSFVVKDLCTSKVHNNEIVLDYFTRFPLKTTKLNSFSLWKYIINQLHNTKVTEEKKAGLKSLCKLVNKAD